MDGATVSVMGGISYWGGYGNWGSSINSNITIAGFSFDVSGGMFDFSGGNSGFV